MDNGQRSQVIRTRLAQALSPSQLDVSDDSASHQGHPGAASGAGHFTITIESAAFADKSRLQCHRMVYALFDDLIPSEIHALRINILKPSVNG